MNYKYLNDDTPKCGSPLFKSPNIPYMECPTPDPCPTTCSCILDGFAQCKTMAYCNASFLTADSDKYVCPTSCPYKLNNETTGDMSCVPLKMCGDEIQDDGVCPKECPVTKLTENTSICCNTGTVSVNTENYCIQKSINGDCDYTSQCELTLDPTKNKEICYDSKCVLIPTSLKEGDICYNSGHPDYPKCPSKTQCGFTNSKTDICCSKNSTKNGNYYCNTTSNDGPCVIDAQCPDSMTCKNEKCSAVSPTPPSPSPTPPSPSPTPPSPSPTPPSPSPMPPSPSPTPPGPGPTPSKKSGSNNIGFIIGITFLSLFMLILLIFSGFILF